MNVQDVVACAANLVRARRLPNLSGSNRRADSLDAIGQAIRESRRAQRRTQAELAKAAGIGTRAVNEVENGRRPHISATSLLKLAHAAGVRLLLDTTPDRPEP